MPRTIVELPPEQIRCLDQLRKNQRISRSALIRTAVGNYLEQHRGKLASDAFGLWRNRPLDARHHEDALRSEWDR